MPLFEIGKTYSFNTRAPGILPDVKNAKLIYILDYDTALQFIAVRVMFRNIFPSLPIGTVDNPESFIYYRFLSESGEKIVLCEPWIDETTIETIDHITFQVTFTQASLEDMARVRNLINALSMTNYTIKQI